VNQKPVPQISMRLQAVRWGLAKGQMNGCCRTSIFWSKVQFREQEQVPQSPNYQVMQARAIDRPETLIDWNVSSEPGFRNQLTENVSQKLGEIPPCVGRTLHPFSQNPSQTRECSRTRTDRRDQFAGGYSENHVAPPEGRRDLAVAGHNIAIKRSGCEAAASKIVSARSKHARCAPTLGKNIFLD